MNSELPDFDALWDYDDPAATERRFRALPPRAEGGTPAYHVELLTQIGRAEGLQRKFDQAHATLDQAGALLTEAMARARARYLLERGRVFNSSKQPARARPLFQETWELAKTHGEDFYAIDAAHMLAIVEPPEHRLAWNLKALDLTEQTADERARTWRGSLYNNIGWGYHEAGRYAQALEMFQKALRCREETGDPSLVRIARWCVARTLRSLGRTEEALSLQRQLLDELEQTGEVDGYVYEELAECLLALGRIAEARVHFAGAYAELSNDPWLAESEPTRIERLKEISG